MILYLCLFSQGIEAEAHYICSAVCNSRWESANSDTHSLMLVKSGYCCLKFAISGEAMRVSYESLCTCQAP